MNRAPKRRRRWLRRLIWTIVLLLILGGAGYYAYASLKQEYTVTYDSYTATTGSISNALSFSGNLQLIDSASYASSANTSVRKLYVAAGDEVHAGDDLIRLANGTTIEDSYEGCLVPQNTYFNTYNVRMDQRCYDLEHYYENAMGF